MKHTFNRLYHSVPYSTVKSWDTTAEYLKVILFVSRDKIKRLNKLICNKIDKKS